MPEMTKTIYIFFKLIFFHVLEPLSLLEVPTVDLFIMAT